MSADNNPQTDAAARKGQLVILNKNLNILLEREARYAGNAPLDLLNQISDHRQAIDLMEQTLAGRLTETELNEALKPLLLALRDGQVIQISAPPPRWLRPIAIATLGVVMLTLVGIGFLVWRGNGAGEEQALATPDPALLEMIAPPEPNWSVSALTLQNKDGQSILWLGAEADSKYALYYMDTAPKAKAKPEHALEVEQPIINLAVDCKGNVWILMSQAGTRVFRPQTGQADTLLNIETTRHWLSKTTTYAIATRCLDDGAVEVWLGREGVHTLQYRSDYPTLDTITFAPPEKDKVYQASKELTNIRALSYITKNQTLWAADLYGKLLTVPLNSVLARK